MHSLRDLTFDATIKCEETQNTTDREQTTESLNILRTISDKTPTKAPAYVRARRTNCAGGLPRCPSPQGDTLLHARDINMQQVRDSIGVVRSIRQFHARPGYHRNHTLPRQSANTF